jgi:hypothetical protein
MSTRPIVVSPTIGSFELHLTPDVEFTAKGWGRKVRKLGGDFQPARGRDDTRFVTVPNTDAGRKLIGELLAQFGFKETTVIVRCAWETQFFMGDANAPTTVHDVRRDNDPHTAIDGVIAEFHRLYARLVRRAFRAQARAWYRKGAT